MSQICLRYGPPGRPRCRTGLRGGAMLFFGSELIRKRFFTMVIEVYRGYIMLYLYMYGLYMVISVNISYIPTSWANEVYNCVIICRCNIKNHKAPPSHPLCRSTARSSMRRCHQLGCMNFEGKHPQIIAYTLW